jgi:hypothetical protein
MIHEISSLVKEFLAAVVFGLNHQFDCFFTYFLCNFIDAAGEQAIGIRAFFRMLNPLSNDLLKEFNSVDCIFFLEASVCAGVTDRSLWQDFQQDRVAVAIQRQAYELHVIS